ncbi:unnamed protein product [Caretta caretta]
MRVLRSCVGLCEVRAVGEAGPKPGLYWLHGAGTWGCGWVGSAGSRLALWARSLGWTPASRPGHRIRQGAEKNYLNTSSLVLVEG